jgi:hypothetical protein
MGETMEALNVIIVTSILMSLLQHHYITVKFGDI